MRKDAPTLLDWVLSIVILLGLLILAGWMDGAA